MCCLRVIKLLSLICLIRLADLTVVATHIDDRLAADNKDQGSIGIINGSALDDLAYLRKASIDLIGRVPTVDEIQQYENWHKDDRRDLLLDKLFKDGRFADRWTIFFSDLLLHYVCSRIPLFLHIS